ncbi:MAG: carbohydrate ABC transporter permease [bacterium]|nr:carbohydrate ABC transporter permease [bacterium]
MIKKRTCFDLIRFFILLFFAGLFIFPLVWIIATSLKSEIEVRTVFQLLPQKALWNNYVKAWLQTNFSRQFFNSFIIAFCATTGQILTSFLAGYAFARFHFPGKRIAFTVFIATLIIPYQLLIVPIFMMFSKLNLIDTFLALILPSIANAFGIYLYKTHIETIPRSLEEAAQIDGASHWTILWSIIFPLSKAPTITLFLLTFTAEWNDLFKPLIFTSSEEMRTVQLGLTAFQETFSTNYTLLMAAVVFVTAPVLLLFIIGQKYFIRGIAVTGQKNQ